MTESVLLHELVFKNDVDGLRAELAKFPRAGDGDGADGSSNNTHHHHPGLAVHCRGHTPLTLAVSLNRKECVPLLLDAGASTLLKTADGWSPYQEATSVGDRAVMELLFKRRRAELAGWFQGKGKALLESMAKDLKDFYLEMHWTFSSWIPFVSKICPSDTYKISKQGTSIRIDTTLVGFERLSWIRGDISIIFSDTPEGPKLVICDHQRNLVQQIYPQEFKITQKDIEEEISVSLNTNIVAPPEADFQSFNLTRAQSGFWSFKIDRNERVGPWDTSVWNVESFEFVNRVRNEHLKVNPLPAQAKRELAKAAAAAKKASGGLVIANATDEDESEDEGAAATEWTNEAAGAAAAAADADYKDWSLAKKHFRELAAYRGTLDPPAPPSVTFEEFFDPAMRDKYLHVGRPKEEVVTNRAFKATLWMYNSSPQTVGASGDKDAAAAAAGAAGDAKPDAPPPAAPAAAPAPQSLTASVLSWMSGADSSVGSTTGPPPIQSADFPLQIGTVLPLLDLIGMASNQHVRSLREFFNVQLPPGFPVRVEVPINMTPLSAVVTFQNIVTEPKFAPKTFVIPGKKEGYRVGEVWSPPQRLPLSFGDDFAVKLLGFPLQV
ncbi:GPCR-chaperone-domain-containing protein [Zopfochytrium polystomum]|nr:GPCR-chaperone-domain-containing protein [Zopfochytrium polystomum]